MTALHSTDLHTPDLHGPGGAGAGGVAGALAPLLETVLGGELPIRLRAWDGSEAGPADAPVVVLRSRRVLRRLLRSPGELGLARAYVTGDLDVDGDLLDGFRRAWGATRARGPAARPAPAAVAAAAAKALRPGVLAGLIGRVPPPPAAEARLSGRLHSRGRDRDAIAHHYDLSNDFYALILDPAMAYSCAYWTSDDPAYTLVDAQRDKLDLVCRKLALGPGSRLLDVGCGWGSLTLHAAQTYGATVTAVTLSAQQRAFVRERVRERGLGDRVDVRLQDYREVTDGPFDAVSTIEMGEHVGAENYPGFAAGLAAHLRPQGRLVVQQMSRRGRHPGGGPFIEAYIAPDMHMRPVGETVELLEAAGLEVREVQAMREHYVRTVHAWYDTFESNFARAVDLVGEQVARVWRLYLVGGALAFEEQRMGVDQILAVKPDPIGRSGLPPTPAAWAVGAG